MAATQYNKYIWLVDTIRSAGKITKAEIDRRWLHANLNEYHESRIPDRTFFRCLNEIEMLFDIEIKCQRSPYGGQLGWRGCCSVGDGAAHTVPSPTACTGW